MIFLVCRNRAGGRYLVPELRLLEALEVAVVLAVDLAVARPSARAAVLVVGALRRLLVPAPVEQRRVEQLPEAESLDDAGPGRRDEAR